MEAGMSWEAPSGMLKNPEALVNVFNMCPDAVFEIKYRGACPDCNAIANLAVGGEEAIQAHHCYANLPLDKQPAWAKFAEHWAAWSVLNITIKSSLVFVVRIGSNVCDFEVKFINRKEV